jgi:hypothetical protein
VIGVVGSAVAMPGGGGAAAADAAADADDEGEADDEVDAAVVGLSLAQAAINELAAAEPTPRSASRRNASRRLSRPST